MENTRQPEQEPEMHPRIAQIAESPWLSYRTDRGQMNDWHGLDYTGPDGIVRISAATAQAEEPILVANLTRTQVLNWQIEIPVTAPWPIVRAAVTAAFNEAAR